MNVDLPSVHATAKCECGNELQIHFVGVEYTTTEEINELSEQIKAETESQGWRAGECQTCRERHEKEYKADFSSDR